MADMALRLKQQRFVQEYCVDFNGTQAAIRAGYSLLPWKNGPGYYVYALIDPRNEQIFYIGKGKGKRCFAHEKNWLNDRVDNPQVFARISKIRNDGMSLEIRLFEMGMTEPDAYALERHLILAIGKDNLTNLKRGQETESQRVSAKAKDLLDRAIPFEMWLSTRPRTVVDIEIYHEVIAGLQKIAAQ